MHTHSTQLAAGDDDDEVFFEEEEFDGERGGYEEDRESDADPQPAAADEDEVSLAPYCRRAVHLSHPCRP